MKQCLLFLFANILLYTTKAQGLSTDSLQGFSIQNAVTSAHQKNMEGAELKIYVEQLKAKYIAVKYNLDKSATQKYSPAVVNNLPCYNEDFESFPVGVVTASMGWVADQCQGCIDLCTNSFVSMTTNTTAVAIYSTQITDPICGSIGSSPFGGNQLVKLNDQTSQVGRIRQTFPVTGTNFIYSYAYKGVLAEPIHNCCDDAYLMFRFYDPSGSIISSMSHTVMMGTPPV